MFQVYRNEAEQRVRAVIAGKTDPALSGMPLPESKVLEAPINDVAASVAQSGPNDLAQAAEDAIRFKIGTVFRGIAYPY